MTRSPSADECLQHTATLDLEAWAHAARPVLQQFGLLRSSSTARILRRCNSVLTHRLAAAVVRNEWPAALPHQCVVAIAAGANAKGALWLTCAASPSGCVLLPIPRERCEAYQSGWAAQAKRPTETSALEADLDSLAVLTGTYQRMLVVSSCGARHRHADLHGALNRLTVGLAKSLDSNAKSGTLLEFEDVVEVAPSTPIRATADRVRNVDILQEIPTQELPEAMGSRKRSRSPDPPSDSSPGPPSDPPSIPSDEPPPDLTRGPPALAYDALLRRVWDASISKTPTTINQEQRAQQREQQMRAVEQLNLSSVEFERLRGMLDSTRLRDLQAVERGSMSGLRGAVLERKKKAFGQENHAGDACLNASLEVACAAYQPLSEFASAASAVIKKATPLIRPLLAAEMIEAYECQLVARHCRIAELERRVGPARAPPRTDADDLHASWNEASKDAVAIVLMRRSLLGASFSTPISLSAATSRADARSLAVDRSLAPGSDVATRLREMAIEQWERHFVQFAQSLGRTRALELVCAATEA